nr:LuxR C-terminal-related transcriptional regulator [Streptacidiphilus rugosus]
MLEPLGLDALTEAVYRAMLAQPEEGTAELAVRLSMTEGQIAYALGRLNRLALVRPSYEAAGGRLPVRAEAGMELLLARQEAALQGRLHRLAVSRAAAAQLVAEAGGLESPDTDVGVEVLVGIDRIRDRLAALSRDVEEELLAFAPDGAQTNENMQASGPLNAALLARGVRLRTVYLTSIRSHQPTLAHARRLVEQGAQVRTVATLPTRMLIVDRRIAFLPMDIQDSRRGALVVTGAGADAGIVVALRALFESVWAEGQALDAPTAEERTAARQRELSTQEIATLRLMATGLTLGGIAKRLGVSPRTARRITAALLERLDAGSRFEAGVKAVQRGWLPVDG